VLNTEGHWHKSIAAYRYSRKSADQLLGARRKLAAPGRIPESQANPQLFNAKLTSVIAHLILFCSNSASPFPDIATARPGQECIVEEGNDE